MQTTRARSSSEVLRPVPEPEDSLDDAIAAALAAGQMVRDLARFQDPFLADGPPQINAYRYASFGLDLEYATDLCLDLGIEPGAGVTIIHVDEGWQLDHPYFESFVRAGGPYATYGPVHNTGGREEHGGAVLGMHVGGLNGYRELRPLLPGAKIVLASALHRAGDALYQSIVAAIDSIAPGTACVLLIARDWSSRAPNLPFALRPGATALLRRATERGIVTVLAAGNGGMDLDRLVVRESDRVSGQVLDVDDPTIAPGDRLTPAFALDSGAIIAGAVTTAPPHTRWTAGFAKNPTPRSNFGSRIDCSAPGDHIFTARSFGTSGRPRYTASFGGTSAAAAIVAAAAALIQCLAMHTTERARPFEPAEVRALLRDASLGQRVGSATEWMGTMPDLRAIARHVIGHHPASRDERPTGMTGW